MKYRVIALGLVALALWSRRSAKRAVYDLPERLGFDETAKLRQVKAEALQSLRWHDPDDSETLEAFKSYQVAGERVVAALPEPQQPPASVGLMIAKALIWRQGGRPVHYLTDLGHALERAYQLGLSYPASVLSYERTCGYNRLAKEAVRHGLEYEYGQQLQAEYLHDWAIDFYIAYKNRADLTKRKRGLANLRLAECYQAIIDLGQWGTGEPPVDLLRESLISAAHFLQGHPEHGHTMGMLEKLEADYT